LTAVSCRLSIETV